MRNITICSLALSALTLSVVAHERADGGKGGRVREDQVIPCYVVISNIESEDNERRRISVLMDKSDVNEENFIKLQHYFSSMYPNVELLNVHIQTSLNFRLGNYTTTEDSNALRAALAGLPYVRKPKIWEKDAQGFLSRDGETEKFGYKGEGGDLSDMKYVLIKGEDPHCGSCKRLETYVTNFTAEKASAPKRTDGSVSCYFELGNVVMNNRRFIRLLINKEDGNEPNLKGLLRHFVRQYTEPDALVIKVYTDLAQDQDFVAPVVNRYFVAALFRANGNEAIRYQRPHEQASTLVVQGVDIFPSLDNYLETEGRRN